MESSLENSSRLPQPTRIPTSPGKALHETSESQKNLKFQSMMPPPKIGGLKHKPTGLQEPEPKRKIWEKAADYETPAKPAPRSAVKGTSLVGGHMKKSSTSSSIARPGSQFSSRPTRTPSVSSRSTQNANFSKSVGGDALRPHTSIGNNRPNIFSQSTMTRPPSSVALGDTNQDEVDKRNGFDVHSRLDDIEAMYSSLKESLNGGTKEQKGLEEALGLYKARINELELNRSQLQIEVDTVRQQLVSARTAQEDDYRTHRNQVDDLERQHRRDLDQLNQDLDQLRRQLEQIRRENADEQDRASRSHRDELRDLELKQERELREVMQRHEAELRESEVRKQAEVEVERRERLRAEEEFKTQFSAKQQDLQLEAQQKERDIQATKADLEAIRAQLDLEQANSANLQQKLLGADAEIIHLKNELAEVNRRVHFLESDSKAQSDSFASLDRQLQDAIDNEKKWKEKLIKEETLRRILFNQVQELKGNIRVMCRVRPAFSETEVAQIEYPDLDKESKELVLHGQEEKSALGKVTRKVNNFAFDRVFGPSSMNEEVFGEIQQLVQSALDGYNVCIFCYGQTGAGKTHTMSSTDGMIPRATHFIYETATNLQEKGWEYSMEGSFVEVYNEDIHDLLGNPNDFDKKKHEIRHDDKKKQTTVTGLKTVMLDSPEAVETIMKRADENRSVAATKSNERSSRSHSVFILKLVGKNTTTGETSEGTLNLVDLAGSERLKSSGAEGDRMKETQNINKSLSCLGDVIAALGQGEKAGHIPYRNSKLTYLLQYSLGGNSKTLMFVMISPLEQHLRETLTSLKFATKVHNTHIGTAKASKKIRERGSDSSGL